MTHSATYEAIILKAYDVGEADRFLILLTKERGRIAARARGARRLHSRLGGHLLPFQHVMVILAEGSAGFLVTSVQKKTHTQPLSIVPFLSAQQGIEVLLALLHDEEPLPDVFRATLQFIGSCQEQNSPSVLPYTITLLALLGLLPDLREANSDLPLNNEERSFARQCCAGEWHHLPPLSEKARVNLQRHCSLILAEQSIRTLCAPKIAMAITNR